MKKLFIFLFTLALMLTFVSCDTPSEETTAAETTTEETSSTEQTTEAKPSPDTDTVITYLNISYTEENGTYHYLSLYPNETDYAFEFVGDVKKVGTFDEDAFAEIALTLEQSGFLALRGQSVSQSGNAYASMYVSFADGAYITADYSGVVAEEFLNAYRILESKFQELAKDIPVYIPQPLVIGDVDDTLLAELMLIVDKAEFAAPDSFYISHIPMDEYFSMTMGLSSADGILNGAEFSPVMMPTPYSLVIVTVENADMIDAVRKDFSEHIQWNKWVCVSADHALIAQKGDLVLCMIGSGTLYRQSSSAIESAGWTNLLSFNR